jgi:hypothetical protein
MELFGKNAYALNRMQNIYQKYSFDNEKIASIIG